MKSLFINKSFNYINKYKTLNELDKIKIKYGLEVMYYFVTKTIIILVMALIFNVFKEVLIFNLFYIPLRSLAHGFHAKNNLHCWIITLVSYIFIIIFIKYVTLDFKSLIIMDIIAIISFIFWSPADTKNLPLIHKKNRTKLKILSLIFLTLEVILSTMFLKYRNYISIAIILETININPITYKIFRLKYNNYVEYS